MVVTWNPADKDSHITLSDGDLTMTNSDSGGYYACRATEFKTEGKWYWEFKIVVDRHTVGIGTSASNLASRPGSQSTSYGYSDDGYKWHNGIHTSGYSGFTVNDVIGIALDLDAGKIWWAKNNVWQESGDPANGANPAYTGISGSFSPFVGLALSNASGTATFVAANFTYTPPAGFYSLEILCRTSSFDGKIIIKDSATNLIDGKTAISPETELFDGKIKIQKTVNIPFDGKVRVKNSANNLFDGETKIKDSASNLFNGRIIVTNTGQIYATCPTPISNMAATFRYARMCGEIPAPTAQSVVGKRIQGDSPVPGFTCTAYFGRNPSLIVNSPCPTCSMRVGVVLDVAGISIPTCTMVADTHHLVTIYGSVPCPLITCDADTENIAALLGLVPCPRGLFDATIGNVANIWARVPCPSCSIIALNGQVVTLTGSAPVPGDLVRFYASLKNGTITLDGTVPTPDMISSVHCLTSLILRHIRGEIR